MVLVETIAESLGLALKHHQAGDFQRAKDLYCRILNAHPEHAESWHLLGVLAYQLGLHEVARNFIGTAVTLDAANAIFYLSLGTVAVARGQLEEAVENYRRAVERQPDLAEAHYSLANALLSQGKRDLALHQYRRALECKPDYAEAYKNLGVLLKERGQVEEALRCFQQAVQHKPDYALAHFEAGNARHVRGELDAALACYRQALRFRPNLFEAHINLGNVLKDQNRLDEALASYRCALLLQPDSALTHNNLGVIYLEQGKLPDAEASFQRALEIAPDLADTHNNLGLVLTKQGRLDESLASHQKAVDLAPANAEWRLNRALAWILDGNYAQGWPEFEWRLRHSETALRTFPQPFWTGAALDGKTILIHTEQGLGDTFLFLRYVRLVKERGGRVLLECPPLLLRVLRGCPGVDALVGRGSALPPFDVHVPLLSLPAIFKTTLASVPAAVPYLCADPELVRSWGNELHSVRACKIGIQWQGNPRYRADRDRSFPLAFLEPLARLEGVQLISLQKGPGSEQIGALAGRFSVLDPSDRLDVTRGAFMDTAAVIHNLDLVIAADTVVAHLAGALGAPLWAALSFVPCWYWQLRRTDSCWYPSARLFRQPRPGDWEPVFRQMAAELRQKLTRTGPKKTLLAEISPGELIDKITILQIKREHIGDAAKLHNVLRELETLEAAHEQMLKPSADLLRLTAELKTINSRLWDIEDEIRDRERNQDFGSRFIELARSVYRSNDRRAALKRQINELLGSALIEEKAYTPYD